MVASRSGPSTYCHTWWQGLVRGSLCAVGFVTQHQAARCVILSVACQVGATCLNGHYVSAHLLSGELQVRTPSCAARVLSCCAFI